MSSTSVLVAGLPCHPNLNATLSSPTNTSNTRDGDNLVMKVDGFKWRLVIAYDGTRYAGWQYQSSPPTIQRYVEKALMGATKLERKDLHLVGASRTDKGVHAWGQVAHFVTPFNYDSIESIHSALNGNLPEDIRVREISPAVPEFHARFSAQRKVYHYRIYNDTFMDPFQRHSAYHSAHKLNPAVMREAAKYFIGKHDFSAFVNASQKERVRDPVKDIFRFDVVQMGALLQLEVEGSGFLYRQVRNMVAMLLQIGREAVPPDIIPKILATRDRRELAKYSLLAPPQGLCLMTVKYNEEHLRLPSGSPNTSFGRHYTINSSLCGESSNGSNEAGKEGSSFGWSSRTDKGVHAWGQVAHFVTPFNYDRIESIHSALNGNLPEDIRVREISPAVPEFHARFSAQRKVYHYRIYNDTFMDPFQRHNAYHSAHKLNPAVMREAAKYFIGKHDFSAFVNASQKERVRDPVKDIFRFDVLQMGALLQLEVEGSGFLYRQVRNMVALLLQIGREAVPPDIVPKILATRDRRELAKYSLLAPPQGLCLMTVEYNEDHLRLPSGSPNSSFGRHYTIKSCKLPFY